MAKENGNAPLEAGRHLAALVVDRVVVGAIAHGWLDLEETLQRITLGAVARLDPLGETRDVVAAHLSRSTRWLHRHLHHLREGSKPRDSRRPSGESRGPLVGDDGYSDGYRLMLKVVKQLQIANPEGLPLHALRVAVRRESWQMDDTVLQDRLRLYTSMGVLRLIEGGSSQPKYVPGWVAAVPPVASHRGDEMGDCLEALLPLLLDDLKDRSHSRVTILHMAPTALARAQSRLGEFIDQVTTDAILESRGLDEPTLEVSLMWCMGTYRKRDS